MKTAQVVDSIRPFPRGTLIVLPHTGEVASVLEDTVSNDNCSTIKYRTNRRGWKVDMIRSTDVGCPPISWFPSLRAVAWADNLRVTAQLVDTELEASSPPFRLHLRRGTVLNRYHKGEGIPTTHEDLYRCIDRNGGYGGRVLGESLKLLDRTDIAKLAVTSPTLQKAFDKAKSGAKGKYHLDISMDSYDALALLPDWPMGVLPGDKCLVDSPSGPEAAVLLTADVEGYVVEYDAAVGEHSFDGMGRRNHCSVVGAGAILERL